MHSTTRDGYNQSERMSGLVSSHVAPTARRQRLFDNPTHLAVWYTMLVLSYLYVLYNNSWDIFV